MRQRQLPLVKLFALQKKLMLAGGKQTSPSTVECDLAGSCENPVGVELVARESHRVELRYRARSINSTYWTPAVNGYLRVVLSTRCRKCMPCKRKRAHGWRLRAIHECSVAPRNWMGTLTFPHEAHVRKEYELHAALAKQGIEFRALPSNVKFGMQVSGYRVNELDRHKTVLGLGDEVTKWLKRVRKNSGSTFRYLCVTEAHMGGGKNHGFPHFHVLLSEIHGRPPIRKAVMDDAWPHFAGFKLADERSPFYVCKYLVKDLTDVRVRASVDYGYYEVEKLHSPSKAMF